MDDEARVRSLLEEVLNSGRSPEEVCSAQPEHLERVRSRWRHIRELAGDLERLLPSPGRGWPRDPVALLNDQKTLPRIPGYELTAMIGHGGMGAVYKARHLKLDRMVALKTLVAGDFAAVKELEGLLREARTVAGLGHPHIVEVYDAGEVDGLPYFTMELVEGGSLAEKLKGVPLPPREAAVLVERLSAAVQAAHDRGIVHRDLKPANILLTSDATPKIADFGLARRSSGDSQRTTGSARFGTPSYMPPEQALGTPAAFEPSVDVYALGAILYETLTGRPPFRADSPIETQRQVVEEAPVAPSRINRRVPRDVETICLKCLQKSPSARYASAGRLNDDLRRFLGGEPIVARKTGAIVRGLKWARRHPTTTTALGFALLVTIAAIIGGAWWVATAANSRKLVENDLVEVERAQRGSDWVAATSALDRAEVHLGAGGPIDLRSRLETAQRNSKVVKGLEAVRLTRALGFGNEESHAQSDRDYANLYRDACAATDAESPQEAARRVRASTIGTALIAGMYDWQVASHDQPRREWILAVLRIADSDDGGWRDQTRDTAMWDHPDALARLIAESSIAGQSVDYLLWLSALIRDIGADPVPLLRRIQSAHSNDFWANHVLAEELHKRKQDLEALRFVQASIAIRPDVAASHNNLGNYLRYLCRFDESIEQLEEAVRLDPATPLIRGNLGLTLIQAGRPADALKQVEAGLRLAPDGVFFHANLGQVLAALDRHDEAVLHLKKADALDPKFPFVRASLVNELVLTRRGPEAVAQFQAWIGPNRGSYAQWDGLAELCLLVGATESYEETRTNLLELFGSSDDPVACEGVGRACTLAPIPDDEQPEASAVIDRALAREQRQPASRGPSLRLVKAMAEIRCRHAEEALRLVDGDVSKVLQPLPQLVAALALADLHRDAEGLAMLGRAAAMTDWRLSISMNPDEWRCHALRREAASKLLPNQEAFQRGTYWPATAAEKLALLATSEESGMHLASARLFAELFASDSFLARDSGWQCRFRAACAAAMCGCNPPPEDRPITPAEQGQWRKQSLQWLREELAALRERASKVNRTAMLSQWLFEHDLRGVRDPALLTALPEDERAAFGAFWTQANGVLASTASN